MRLCNENKTSHCETQSHTLHVLRPLHSVMYELMWDLCSSSTVGGVTAENGVKCVIMSFQYSELISDFKLFSCKISTRALSCKSVSPVPL